MKGKRKQIKYFKMEHRIQSARERTGLNSRQVKRQAKREEKCRNKVENKVENNIRSSKPNRENLLLRRWIPTIFGVFCAIVSYHFGLFIYSDPIKYTLYNFTAIYVFSLVLNFFYPRK